MKKWFSYDANGDGFLMHNNAGDARAFAEGSLKDALYNVGVSGFEHGTEKIIWGELLIEGQVKVVDGKAILTEVID